MSCCSSPPPPLPAGASALRVDGAPGMPKRETPFKVVVMGDKGIGKSAIVCRFTRGAYSDGMATTIGAAFAMKDVACVAAAAVRGAIAARRREIVGRGVSVHDSSSPPLLPASRSSPSRLGRRVEEGVVARLQIWGARDNKIFHQTRRTPLLAISVTRRCARDPTTRRVAPLAPPPRADTAGEELYRAMTRNFFREAAAGVIVYDVTNQTSFASTMQWLADFSVRAAAMPRRRCAPRRRPRSPRRARARAASPRPQDACPDALAVLVGNKADLVDARRVLKADGSKFADERALPFFEVSAKTGERVEDVFRYISAALIERKRAASRR